MTDTLLFFEIRERLEYNPEKGEFRRRAGFQGVKAGALVGTIATGGKLQATFFGKRYQVDALVWLMEYETLPKGVIVHKNMNASDSRIGNLIDCTQSEAAALRPNVMERRQRRVLRIEKREKDRKPALTKKEMNQRRNGRRAANIDVERAKEQAYREANREIYRKSLRKHHRKNINDPQYKASKACRQILNRTISACKLGKSKRTEDILGYSFHEFREHMELLFDDWMHWGNHGEWHIDHIKPVSAYVAEGVTDPKTINALANLRPLLARENLSKGSRYTNTSKGSEQKGSSNPPPPSPRF